VGDERTLEFYSREARTYADYAAAEAGTRALDRFAAMVRPGGRVLDFGCGSGWAADRLASLGFEVEAFDGSVGLAEEALRRYGLSVAVGRFEEFAAPSARFDGIWCAFSLLHDARDAMPGHLARLAEALVPGGAVYLGLKEGRGAARDRLGRLYVHYERGEIVRFLEEAGFFGAEVDAERTVGFDGDSAAALHVFARRA